MPDLADPCDVTRTHDTASRIVEQARVVLLPAQCRPCPDRCGAWPPYHRVRVLLGLDEVGRRRRRAKRRRRRRARRRRMPPARAGGGPAATTCGAWPPGDAADLRPACQEGTEAPTPLPGRGGAAPVVLACVEIDVRDADGCTTVREVRLDECCRCVLLPTQTIGELLFGLAGALFRGRRDNDDYDEHEGDNDHDDHYDHDEHGQDGERGHGARGEGPRVYADDVVWDEEQRRYLIPVSAELVAGSVRHAITVTSLSARGWVDEDARATFDAPERRIVVELGNRPVNSVVRILVRGTGPTPVYGVDPPAPLAGVRGGRRASRHDGNDAVITVVERLGEGEGL